MLARTSANSLFLLGLVVGLGGLAGCSGGPADPSISSDPAVPPQLAGFWTAEKMELTSIDNPELRDDIVADYGATFTLRIETSGRYEAILTVNEIEEKEPGNLAVDGSSLTFDPDDDVPRDGTWSLEGGMLIIRGESTYQGQPADLLLEMIRS